MMMVGVRMSVPKIFRRILRIATRICWKNSHDASIWVVEGNRLSRVTIISYDALSENVEGSSEENVISGGRKNVDLKEN